jgi:flagellar FliL protein
MADLPPPDIGDLVDYTSEPEEEPQTLADRLRNVSPAVKALLVLVPLLVVVLIITAVALAFMGGGGGPEAPAPEITITKADMIDEEGTIKVEADTTLTDGTRVTAVMLEDGEEIDWFSDDTARGSARDGSIDMTLPKNDDAPFATRGEAHSIRLSAEVDGETIEATEELEVIRRFEIAFYGPDATPTPTEAPATSTPEETEDDTPPVTPTAAPAAPTTAPEPSQGIAVVVGNGGNVRAQPSADANIVGAVTLGDEVQVLQKTADSVWYEIRTDQGVNGWAHRVVLQPDEVVAAQVPVRGQDAPAAPPDAAPTGLTVSVFNGGNVRAQPALADNIVGGVNAGETVELLAKTADGVWYQVRTERNVEGWAHNTLLTIPDDVAAQVPIAQG